MDNPVATVVNDAVGGGQGLLHAALPSYLNPEVKAGLLFAPTRVFSVVPVGDFKIQPHSPLHCPPFTKFNRMVSPSHAGKEKTAWLPVRKL